MRRDLLALFLLFSFLPAGCGGGGGGDAAEGADAGGPLVTLESGTVGFWGADLDGQVPGLVAFDLAFLNGDHHVARIAVGGVASDGLRPDPNSFLLGLQDGNGGDPVAMSATFFDLSGIATRKVVSARDLQGTGWLSIEELAPGERFVLSGFHFETDGDDHELRWITIRPGTNSIMVRYEDDSPGDDVYNVTIAYAVLPAERDELSPLRPTFGFARDRTRDFDFVGTGGDARAPTGVALISGFSLLFTRGNRHVERIGIDLRSVDRRRATLRDGSPDDPDDNVQAFVEWIPIIL